MLAVDSSEPPDPSLWLKQHLIHSSVLIPDESLGNLLIKSHGSNLKGFWNQSKKFSTNKSSQPTSHHADHAHHAATHSANTPGRNLLQDRHHPLLKFPQLLRFELRYASFIQQRIHLDSTHAPLNQRMAFELLNPKLAFQPFRRPPVGRCARLAEPKKKTI